jgi:hypothetical protein
MKFPDARYGEYYMPIIPITLSRGDACIVTEALVDSGAASSIFDAEFADALGIKSLRSGKKIVFEGVLGHRRLPARRHAGSGRQRKRPANPILHALVDSRREGTPTS